ncbi:HAD family hydrolase [Streptomyces sp. NPDC102441]|uniref:HAD family hydrolase n=1 Tax=Streptomyces sp. NPDC102441 TaxID=3366176 RepID=UPI00381B9291
MLDTIAQGVRGTFRHAAFFDVDETLISAKTMVEFLRHWHETHGDDGCAFRAASNRLQAMAASGIPRSEINREYYRRFAGVSRAHLTEAGKAWWGEYRRKPRAFVPAVRQALEDHRAAGDAVVLVSGSFAGVLDPIAREVGAQQVLCTELTADADGVLTGEVLQPMIGPQKAAGAAVAITGLGLSAADCFAYGDHESDLDLLRLVDHPRVVGGDAVLREHAATYGWPVLPGAEASALPVIHTDPMSRSTDSVSQGEEAMKQRITTPQEQRGTGQQPAEAYWVICRQWADAGIGGSEDVTDIQRATGPLAALESLTAWCRTGMAGSLAWVVCTTEPSPYEVPALPTGELVAAARAEAGALGDDGGRRLDRALGALRA